MLDCKLIDTPMDPNVKLFYLDKGSLYEIQEDIDNQWGD